MSCLFVLKDRTGNIIVGNSTKTFCSYLNRSLYIGVKETFKTVPRLDRETHELPVLPFDFLLGATE